MAPRDGWFFLVWCAIGLAWCGCATKPAGAPATSAASVERPDAVAAAAPTAGFPTGQTWMLVTLGGADISVAEDRARPTLLLEAKESRASGMAGVNRFGGTYTLLADALRFGPLMATKMAGAPEENELERRYLDALAETTRWRLANDTLELLAGERVLARLVRKR